MTVLPAEHGGALSEKPSHHHHHGVVPHNWRARLPSLVVLLALLLCDGFVTGLAAGPGITSELVHVSNANDRNQCLFLNRSISRHLCNLSALEREEEMKHVHLKFCSMYSVYFVFGRDRDDECSIDGSYEECVSCLDRIESHDASACANYSVFQNIIQRFDCRDRYSVIWNCTVCKKAYQDWLCAIHIPYHVNGSRTLPCLAFCSKVEETCPFFRPLIETHAGDPSFICKDPYIHSKLDILHGSEPMCYTLTSIDDADISENGTSLQTKVSSNSTTATNCGARTFSPWFGCGMAQCVHIFWLLQTLFQYLTTGLT